MRRNTKLSIFTSIALAATTVTANVGNCRCVNRGTVPSTGQQLDIANLGATEACCSNESHWMWPRSTTFHPDLISCTQSHDAINFDRWLRCCSEKGVIGTCGVDIGPPQLLRRSIEARNYAQEGQGGEDGAPGGSSGGGGGGGGGVSGQGGAGGDGGYDNTESGGDGGSGGNIYDSTEAGESGESADGDLPPCPEEEEVPEECEEEEQMATEPEQVQGYGKKV